MTSVCMQWVTARGGTAETVNIVDFGSNRNVAKSFAQQRAANAPGQSPPMCSEYYTGAPCLVIYVWC